MRYLVVVAALAITLTGFFPAQTMAQNEISGAAIIREINIARQTPSVYANFIQELRTNYSGRVFRIGGSTPLITREGVSALDEAIAFLRKARPQAPFELSPGLCQAAADHCRDQAFGLTGHRGSDRTNPGDRISRYGTRTCAWAENISYGQRSARGIVMAFIIDDGVRNRGHRKNIFNPTYKFAGAAYGRHAKFGSVCSVDFVCDYSDRLVRLTSSNPASF